MNQASSLLLNRNNKEKSKVLTINLSDFNHEQLVLHVASFFISTDKKIVLLGYSPQQAVVVGGKRWFGENISLFDGNMEVYNSILDNVELEKLRDVEHNNEILFLNGRTCLNVHLANLSLLVDHLLFIVDPLKDGWEAELNLIMSFIKKQAIQVNMSLVCIAKSIQSDQASQSVQNSMKAKKGVNFIGVVNSKDIAIRKRDLYLPKDRWLELYKGGSSSLYNQLIVRFGM